MIMDKSVSPAFFFSELHSLISNILIETMSTLDVISNSVHIKLNFWCSSPSK